MFPFVCLVALLGLSACGSNSKDDEELLPDRPVEGLYNDAQDAMQEGDYAEAANLFNEVERQHPYSEWATRAQLMAAYAYYTEDSYDEAIVSLDRFIRLHPGYKDIDYAYYLMSLSYYDQISDVRRDQKMTENAMQSFDALLTRFPESRYARDARLKRDLTLDHLAGKEMEIGRYYQGQKKHNAAINRFRTVIREYDTTTHTPEALHRMVESYLALGLVEEATRVAAVLSYNYPGSVWYEDTFGLLDPVQRQRLVEANDKSVWSKALETLF